MMTSIASVMTALTGIGDKDNAKCVVLKVNGSNWTREVGGGGAPSSVRNSSSALTIAGLFYCMINASRTEQLGRKHSIY